MSYNTTKKLNDIVDSLPSLRPRFKRGKVSIQGESFELYFRDIMQCIQALYGYAKFAPYLVFAPERHYSDAQKTNCVYHDMHTENQWWTIQTHLEAKKAGATIIPIIISIDKTQITTFFRFYEFITVRIMNKLPLRVESKHTLFI